MDVIEMEIVLVLYIHILCECAVEIECRGGCLSCKGGVIEGYHLYVILPAQLTINRPQVNVIVNVRVNVIVNVKVNVILLLTMYQISPQHPRDIEIGLDLRLSASKESIEILHQELLYVQQILIDVAQNGIV